MQLANRNVGEVGEFMGMIGMITGPDGVCGMRTVERISCFVLLTLK